MGISTTSIKHLRWLFVRVQDSGKCRCVVYIPEEIPGHQYRRGGYRTEKEEVKIQDDLLERLLCPNPTVFHAIMV